MLQFVFGFCEIPSWNILKNILYKNSNPRDFVEKCITQCLERVLTQKVVVSTVPKNDFITVLLYFGKFSIQIRTGINRVMKNNKLPTSIFEFYSRLSASWSIFSHSKIKFLISYVLALFMNLSAVAIILPIMAKLSPILKSEYVNSLEFMLLLERERKGILILP